MSEFQNWVNQNCGFSIAREDLAFIQEGLNGGHSYAVNKADFLKRINPNAEVAVSEEALPESSAGEAEAD